MSYILNHFKTMAAILSAKYDLSAGFKNSSLLGQERETFVSDFLSTHLPSRLSLSNGEIVDSDNRRSAQQDLIIYDERSPRLNIARSNLFFCEGVFATIEVKSYLDKKELQRALANVRTVKELRRTSRTAGAVFVKGSEDFEHVLAYLFAYSGDSLDACIGNAQGFYEGDLQQLKQYGFDFLCVLDKGYVVRNDGVLFEIKKPDALYITQRDREKALMSLFVHMCNWSAKMVFHSFLLADYLKEHWKVGE